jgi:hypothetical protein
VSRKQAKRKVFRLRGKPPAGKKETRTKNDADSPSSPTTELPRIRARRQSLLFGCFFSPNRFKTGAGTAAEDNIYS